VKDSRLCHRFIARRCGQNTAFTRFAAYMG
jgi:hypothetical protein